MQPKSIESKGCLVPRTDLASQRWHKSGIEVQSEHNTILKPSHLKADYFKTKGNSDPKPSEDQSILKAKAFEIEPTG